MATTRAVPGVESPEPAHFVVAGDPDRASAHGEVVYLADAVFQRQSPCGEAVEVAAPAGIDATNGPLLLVRQPDPRRPRLDEARCSGCGGVQGDQVVDAAGLGSDQGQRVRRGSGRDQDDASADGEAHRQAVDPDRAHLRPAGIDLRHCPVGGVRHPDTVRARGDRFGIVADGDPAGDLPGRRVEPDDRTRGRRAGAAASAGRTRAERPRSRPGQALRPRAASGCAPGRRSRAPRRAASTSSVQVA